MVLQVFQLQARYYRPEVAATSVSSSYKLIDDDIPPRTSLKSPVYVIAVRSQLVSSSYGKARKGLAQSPIYSNVETVLQKLPLISARVSAVVEVHLTLGLPVVPYPSVKKGWPSSVVSCTFTSTDELVQFNF